MPDRLKQFGLQVITGKNRSPAAAAFRMALSIIEPFYACMMKLRNACYDRGIFRSHDLGRPTISVGNITTGGTGKTPVVIWLADQLRCPGNRPAILLRGYASKADQQSDEAQLLDQALNGTDRALIPVHPNPSRVQAAGNVLAEYPQTTHFILDDGFQHRRARRDFNLVLISATEPFGFGHVLPRGLLREPLPGLGRASAFLITRCSLVNEHAIRDIEAILKKHQPAAPIFHCDHRESSILLPGNGQTHPIESLKDRRVFLTAGIGDPAAFERQIAGLGCSIVGTKWWSDHHCYTQSDIAANLAAAKQTHAELILTTAKDWVKMKTLASSQHDIPVAVVNLEIQFTEDDARRLVQHIVAAIG